MSTITTPHTHTHTHTHAASNAYQDCLVGYIVVIIDRLLPSLKGEAGVAVAAVRNTRPWCHHSEREGYVQGLPCEGGGVRGERKSHKRIEEEGQGGTQEISITI